MTGEVVLGVVGVLFAFMLGFAMGFYARAVRDHGIRHGHDTMNDDNWER